MCNTDSLFTYLLIYCSSLSSLLLLLFAIQAVGGSISEQRGIPVEWVQGTQSWSRLRFLRQFSLSDVFTVNFTGFPCLLESLGLLFLKILGPGKLWKTTLVLETSGN